MDFLFILDHKFFYDGHNLLYYYVRAWLHSRFYERVIMPLKKVKPKQRNKSIKERYNIVPNYNPRGCLSLLFLKNEVELDLNNKRRNRAIKEFK